MEITRIHTHRDSVRIREVGPGIEAVEGLLRQFARRTDCRFECGVESIGRQSLVDAVHRWDHHGQSGCARPAKEEGGVVEHLACMNGKAA